MLPLKSESVFEDAPEPVGMLWRNLTRLENTLAEKLLQLPLGTLVVVEQDAWILREDGTHVVLCHGNYADQAISEESSRFDFDLGWVDVEPNELQDYLERVTRAIDEFQTVREKTH